MSAMPPPSPRPTPPAPGRSAMRSPGGLGSSLTQSTVLPWLADPSRITAKGFMLPGLVTVLFGIALFAAMTGSLTFWHLEIGGAYIPRLNPVLQVYWVVAAYFCFMMNWALYLFCGRTRIWWVSVAVCVLMLAVLWPPGYLYAKVVSPFFYAVLPGRFMNDANAGVVLQILGAFCGPGLSEELFKALPVLGLAILARNATDPKVRQLGVTEPLDGILIGAASATGFILAETMGKYIPNSMIEVLNPLIEKLGPDQGIALGADSAAYQGLSLLLLRVIQISGHIAYSGYFGYYIGLAMLKPAQAAKLLLIGWFSAAALHAAWDATLSLHLPTGAIFALLTLVSVASYVLLASAILKGREISPTRSQNFASTTLSSPLVANPLVANPVVASPAASPVIPNPAVAPAPPAPNPANVGPRPFVAPAPQPPRQSGAMVLRIADFSKPLVAGATIEPQTLGSRWAGRGGAPIAEVQAHPSNPALLGLRNVSDRAWQVRRPNGKAAQVEVGSTVGLEKGLVIDFDGVEASIEGG
jgi:RsiW-degrading membrane proteinase PrsW (M82 family)